MTLTCLSLQHGRLFGFKIKSIYSYQAFEMSLFQNDSSMLKIDNIWMEISQIHTENLLGKLHLGFFTGYFLIAILICRISPFSTSRCKQSFYFRMHAAIGIQFLILFLLLTLLRKIKCSKIIKDS